MFLLVLSLTAIGSVAAGWGRDQTEKTERSIWGRGDPTTPFSPLHINDCVLWLDAGWGIFQDEEGTIPALSDSAIALWSDRTGNGYDAEQGTNSMRPIYKTGIQNGRPVVRFDGDNDHLITPRMEGEFDNGFTWFIVAAADDGQPPNHQSLFGSISTAGGSDLYFYLFLLQADNGLQGAVYENSVGVHQNVGALDDGRTDFFIMTLCADPNDSLKGYLNSDGITPADLTGLIWSNIASAYTEEIALGGRMKDGSFQEIYRFDGDIAELIIYGRALNEMEIWRIENYLSRKYTITLAVDPGWEQEYHFTLFKLE